MNKHKQNTWDNEIETSENKKDKDNDTGVNL